VGRTLPVGLCQRPPDVPVAHHVLDDSRVDDFLHSLQGGSTTEQ
jgi:hypothetical protein